MLVPESHAPGPGALSQAQVAVQLHQPLVTRVHAHDADKGF